MQTTPLKETKPSFPFLLPVSMDPSASAAIEKPTKRLRRRRNRELFDAFSRIHEVVLISLFLLSYHSLGVSASVELVGETVWRFLCLLSKPLPVFFIGNLIILAVTVLSGVGDGKNGRRGGIADDVYEEYITRRRVISAGGYIPEGSSGIEDEKRIVLYSESGASFNRGKGSRTTAARTDGRAKNGPPRRERKAEKFTDVASPSGRERLALPVAVQEHALESPATIADASTVAGMQVKLKSPSNASINRENDSLIASVTVCDGGAKKGPQQMVKETEKSADRASARGRGRLVEVRSDGSKTVEDMSNEEFNQSVEKYIAKTRRFLQEESMLVVKFDILDRSAGYPWTEHRRSF